MSNFYNATFSFDPWGRMRNATDWDDYTVSSQTMEAFKILGRGFTGHEHLLDYDLINMNGRCYDPILGQFIQPDNYVQMPDFAGGYNRYVYANNNPLIYVDPDGEIFWIPFAIGAALGAFSGYQIADAQGYGIDDIEFWGTIFSGAVIGGLSSGVGASVSTGVGELTASGLLGTMTGGAVSGAINSFAFTAIAGKGINASITQMWRGGLSGLTGGLTGSLAGTYIDWDVGAFLGGGMSSAMNTAFNKGKFGDIFQSFLMGGAYSLANYELQMDLGYYTNPEIKNEYTYRQYRIMTEAAQSSFIRNKEISGRFTSDGDLVLGEWGESGRCTLPKIPAKYDGRWFHTHTNGDINFSNLPPSAAVSPSGGLRGDINIFNANGDSKMYLLTAKLAMSYDAINKTALFSNNFYTVNHFGFYWNNRRK